MSNETSIHATAIVDPKAQLGVGVTVGPHCLVGPDVTIGDRSHLRSHVVIEGKVSLGKENEIFPFAVIGAVPQHLAYKDEPSRVEIGDGNTIRESVTINRGMFDEQVTRMGDENFIMAYSHLGHDAQVGKRVVLANAVQLAGHAIVEDFVFIGGLSAATQHVRIGRYCFIGGGSIVRKDLLPFMSGKDRGGNFSVRGVNSVGLKRQGFSRETIAAVKRVHHHFYLKGVTTDKAMAAIVDELGETDEVRVIQNFVSKSKMGFER